MAASPPRLLYVVNEFYFFWSHRKALALAAQAAGYEIHVAAPATHAWAPSDFDVQELSKLGFTVHTIPLSRRGRNPLEDLRTVAALWRLCRDLRPRIVHLLTIKPVLYGGLVARLSRVPAVIAAVTGLGQVFIERGRRASALQFLLSRLYRTALRQPCARVIVQNEEDGARVAAMAGLRADQVRLIRGSGVDLAEFAPSEEPPGPPLVVLPSRLIWEKGVAEFVEAAQLLRDTGARFALVGDTVPGFPRAVPEQQLRQWQEDGVIEWWGRRTDMPAVLAQSAIVCLPSRYGEGVPRALIEGAAAGRPTVATDIPGCRDIVRHQHNGLIVPPANAAALAVALRTLLEDHGLRRRMGTAGHELVVAHFTVESVIRQTLALYREALGSAA